MVRDGRCVNGIGSLLVARRSLLSDHLSVSSLFLGGKLAMPLYFPDGCECEAMSTAVSDSGIDWASFAERSFVQFWYKMDCTPVADDGTMCTSPKFNDASSNGRSLSFLDFALTTISCCRLLVPDRAGPTAHRTAAAQL